MSSTPNTSDENQPLTRVTLTVTVALESLGRSPTTVIISHEGFYPSVTNLRTLTQVAEDAIASWAGTYKHTHSTSSVSTAPTSSNGSTEKSGKLSKIFRTKKG